MKIFAIYARVELSDPPAWLIEFRTKYDKPYDFHVTFKHPCYLPDQDVAEVKQLFLDFMETQSIVNGPLEIVFDDLISSAGDDSVMLSAQANLALNHLQQGILTAMSQFREYVKPKHEHYELNFQPHLTIGRKLDGSTHERALSELPKDHRLQAQIREVVLSIVREDTPAEAKDPANQTVCNL